mgnify:CR=1 FL=1
MARTTIKEAITVSSLIGDSITINGWVRTFRSNRFIAINDGSTIKNIQAVIDFEKMDESLLKKINTGASISVEGKLVESQGGGQTVEVQVENMKILGWFNAKS